ncbi:FadR/GntR family transcriptional regulator [Actinocorallia longicatena]|uniref:FCD domain-containing protein n=1 Tax=Actinocorallia longicatena TaxID=111803 RepID=A0ABP6PVC8_9ACTN
MDPTVFRAVTRAPLSLLVSGQVRELILSGELPVGTELPSEKDLADQFGVSRSTVREAVRILQAKGLLSGGDTVSTAKPRVSGALASGSASEALESALRLGSVPLGDLVELRLVLEGAAVAKPGAAALEDARAALETMRTPGVGVAEFHDADVRFHICLSGAGGNTAFALVMTALREAIGGHLLDALKGLEDPRPTLDRLAAEHAAILEAVENGSGERAAGLMRAHIWDFYSSALS